MPDMTPKSERYMVVIEMTGDVEQANGFDKADGMTVSGDGSPISYDGPTYVPDHDPPPHDDGDDHNGAGGKVNFDIDEDIYAFRLKYLKRIFLTMIFTWLVTSACLGLISLLSLDDITNFRILYGDMEQTKLTGFVLVGGFGVVSSVVGAVAFAFAFDYLIWPMIISYGLTGVFVLFYLGQEAADFGSIDTGDVLNDPRLPYILWQLSYFFFPVGILGALVTYWVAIRDMEEEYDVYVRQMYIVVNVFGIILSLLLIAHYGVFQGIRFVDDTRASELILYIEIACGGFACFVYLVALFGSRFYEWVPWLSVVASMAIFAFYAAALAILLVQQPGDLQAPAVQDFTLRFNGGNLTIIMQYAVRMLYALTYVSIGCIIKKNW